MKKKLTDVSDKNEAPKIEIFPAEPPKQSLQPKTTQKEESSRRLKIVGSSQPDNSNKKVLEQNEGSLS